MYDPDHFLVATTRVCDLLERLGRYSDWSFGTIGLPVSMAGRGLPKDFQNSIWEAMNKVRSGASSHARLAFDKILTEELPEAVRMLRRAHGAASGGLAGSSWQKGRLTFVLANGGSVGMRYARPDFQPRRADGMAVLLPSSQTGLALAKRLSDHAALDLSGDCETYEIGKKGDTFLPFQITAPDAAHALARLLILTGRPAKDFPHIRKVEPTEETQIAAQDLLTR